MAEVLTHIAPAKINLALHVVGKRSDGYHLIESLAVFAEDGDHLSAEPADADDITVAGRYAAQVPLGEANLIIRARDLLRDRFGEAATPPVALRLEKHLPVASGIGGGSSDAATTMRMLAQLWKLETEEAELAQLGLQLGADVPMCLAGRPLLARGIGEEIEPLKRFPALFVVLVNPGVPLATAHVFQALSRADNETMPIISADGNADAVIDWLVGTRNDLEEPAMSLAPEIGDVLQALRDGGAAVARMSGSGATCFGIFRSKAEAERAAAAISAAAPAWFVSATRVAPVEASDGR